jgi:hypothetical protein
MAHKRVHVKKGKRLPHGYKTIKAANKNEVYGTKDVHIDKGFRIRHGTKTISAADKNSYYDKGGKISSLNSEIAEYEALLLDGSVPKDEKDFAISEIADFKNQIANLEKEKPKPVSKPATVKKESKPSTSVTPQKPSYNCEELIQAEKDRLLARKRSAEEKAGQPIKTPATKNKEAIEKVTDKIESSIEKRLEKGQVSKSEIQKLISETETLLKLLQSALKKV